jgi:hypothetical protein
VFVATGQLWIAGLVQLNADHLRRLIKAVKGEAICSNRCSRLRVADWLL